MSKQDFENVACELRQLTMTDAHPSFGEVLGALCNAFEKSNPKFNREKFIHAAIYEEEKD